jgi:phosphoribosylformylglycinamidine synthase
MHHVLEFAGTPAMSAFRFDRLTRRIAAIGGDLHLERARYWYFSASSAELDEVERSTLAGLLEASAAPERLGNGREFLVLPRLGTVSPWCSKACEIARSCGLGQVRRIERAILYEFASPVPDEAAARVAAVLHDPMTESWRMDRDLARDLFREVSPSSFQPIPLAQLEQANTALGLALSADEIAYLRSMYAARETPPSDVELLMFAQLNSEHCRHKIFNAPFRVDGQVMPLSLFAMIRETHRRAPAGTVLAYRDNAAIIAGGERRAFYPGADGVYRAHAELLHSAIKVETQPASRRLPAPQPVPVAKFATKVRPASARSRRPG